MGDIVPFCMEKKYMLYALWSTYSVFTCWVLSEVEDTQIQTSWDIRRDPFELLKNKFWKSIQLNADFYVKRNEYRWRCTHSMPFVYFHHTEIR